MSPWTMESPFRAERRPRRPAARMLAFAPATHRHDPTSRPPDGSPSLDDLDPFPARTLVQKRRCPKAPCRAGRQGELSIASPELERGEGVRVFRFVVCQPFAPPTRGRRAREGGAGCRSLNHCSSGTRPVVACGGGRCVIAGGKELCKKLSSADIDIGWDTCRMRSAGDVCPHPPGRVLGGRA